MQISGSPPPSHSPDEYKRNFVVKPEHEQVTGQDQENRIDSAAKNAVLNVKEITSSLKQEQLSKTNAPFLQKEQEDQNTSSSSLGIFTGDSSMQDLSNAQRVTTGYNLENTENEQANADNQIDSQFSTPMQSFTSAVDNFSNVIDNLPYDTMSPEQAQNIKSQIENIENITQSPANTVQDAINQINGITKSISDVTSIIQNIPSQSGHSENQF